MPGGATVVFLLLLMLVLSCAGPFVSVLDALKPKMPDT